MVRDPVLNLIEKPTVCDYGATVWSKKSYNKMFEKFDYAQPMSNIATHMKKIWDFAMTITFLEYYYMVGSILTPIIATNKNMDSTPGFPKFLYFDSEKDYLSQVGNKEYIQVWNAEHRGKPIWWSFLKMETLKKKKIKEGDIRMIMCTDPIFTRFGAVFEEDQNTRMKLRTETHQAQVGWCPFFGGLDKRLKRLESKKGVFVEMDWTRFDGTIPPEVFRAIKELRWYYLSEESKSCENRKRWEWYVDNLISKIVLLPTGDVTKINKGNPSGQISTTTDNNMVNTFLTAFEVAVLYFYKEKKVPTVSWYSQNVDSICYGDDRLLVVPKDFYNRDIVIHMYEYVFGMWVKPENVKVSETLEGLSFCGFTFKKINNSWVGVANHDKMLSSLLEPVKRLPDIESLWCKLVSIRLMCENSPEHVKTYLDRQIWRVENFCRHVDIELPDLPASFYAMLWG
uniref:Non-structural polyprotein 1AB n=1 Tax=Avastrovirus sp. TaxID=2809168 RepID=A0AA48X989_9VIRU|nr:RNA-dependent RNA polymerase [Avastrovirus sp.]